MIPMPTKPEDDSPPKQDETAAPARTRESQTIRPHIVQKLIALAHFRDGKFITDRIQ